MKDNECSARARVTLDDGWRVIADGELVEHDFTGHRSGKLSVSDSRLVACDFTGIDVDDCALGGGVTPSTFVGCTFDGMTSRRTFINFARFEGCTFRGVKFRDLRSWAGEFVDCEFSGTLTDGIFAADPPEDVKQFFGRQRNEFDGNDFDGLDMHDAAFRSGIDLSRQRLPTGDDYLYLPDAVGAVAALRVRIAATVPNDRHSEANLLIRSLERRTHNGQHQLLVRISELPRGSDAAADLLRWLANQQN